MLLTEIFTSFDLNSFQWLLAGLCGLLIGMSKTGISGAGLLVVPVMANIFGGKPSAGLVLPMLIFADIFAVKYYNRHANWRHILKLLPWAFAGVIIAMLYGKTIPDENFKRLMGIVVMAGIGLMIWQDLKRKSIKIPDYLWFSAILGLTGGFATMIGNAAGPVMSLYLLSMRLPKNEYIGTAAWFFFIINIFKVPLHIFYWGTIDTRTIFFDSVMIPAILVGALIGIKIVRIIPEKAYRIFIIASTLLAGFFLL